jgi:hypothetical protein
MSNKKYYLSNLPHALATMLSSHGCYSNGQVSTWVEFVDAIQIFIHKILYLHE